MANLSSYLPDGIDESSVAITGGSINGTTIGASTAAAGTFTTFTSNGIDDNADAVAITIDSSERVGVNTTSPLVPLHVAGSTSDADGALGSQSPLFSIQGGNANNQLEFGMDNSGATAIGFIQSRNTSAGAQIISLNPKGGNVGIGTVSPSDKLHVYGGSSGGTTAHSYTQLHVEHNSHAAIQISSPASTESVIFFSDPDDNDVGGVGYYHAQDYMYLRAAGSTRVRVDADGIKFGSDSAAANALDDYEEGTWTPIYAPTSGSFSSVTYGNQIGYYTKIGDVVNLHARLDTTGMSIGSAGGYLLVSGLPFTAHGSAYQSAIVSYSWGFSSVFPTAGSTGTGMTAIYLYAPDRTTSTGSIVPSNLGTGTTYLYISCTYKTS